jgi:phenylacetate-CoA ligase
MDSLPMLLYKMRNRRSSALLSDYRESQWLPPEKVAELQFAAIRELVRHAYEHNDYYRELFNTLGMQPEDIRSLSDFQGIPVLTKEIIKSNIHRMVSRGYDVADLVKNTSGGSTGEPLTFYQEKDLYVKMEANGLLGFVMANWTGRERIFYLWGNPREFSGKKTLLTKLKEQLSNRVSFNSYNYNQEKIARWVQEIRRSGNCFLYGYTSVLADVASFVENNGIRIAGVRGVLTTAEKLYPWQRELLQRSFGAPVFDQYGSREVPGIACECAEGNMHLLAHSAYLEFADDPAVASGSKKIITTCLTNFAMPFLRYEIGDYARPKEGSCRCGRGLPMLEMDIGRTTDRFVTPEGNLVYGTFFVRQMYGQDRVLNFQFHQISTDLVRLFVVRSPGFDAEDAARLEAIRTTIRDKVSPAMRLEIQYLEAIPRTQGGKHRFVISDVAR